MEFTYCLFIYSFIKRLTDTQQQKTNSILVGVLNLYQDAKCTNHDSLFFLYQQLPTPSPCTRIVNRGIKGRVMKYRNRHTTRQLTRPRPPLMSCDCNDICFTRTETLAAYFTTAGHLDYLSHDRGVFSGF